MDIRKVDNKGRIVAGEKGKHYYIEHGLNGTITLKPVPEINVEYLQATTENVQKYVNGVIGRVTK